MRVQKGPKKIDRAYFKPVVSVPKTRDGSSYTVKKAWKALHFIMRILKKRQYQYQKINLHDTSASDSWIWGWELGSLQGWTNKGVGQGAKKAAKFAYHMSKSNWETSQRRKIARICALFKAYSGKRAWKFIGDILQQSNYLSRIQHDWKVRNRRQRTDIGKYSFVNRTILLWNRLPAKILRTLPCKSSAFKKRVRKVINVVN
jgi:hypothetical protein